MAAWGQQLRLTDSAGFDDRLGRLPALAAGGVTPSASFSFGDDLLGEIDGLLEEQDVLLNFWQSPGQ